MCTQQLIWCSCGHGEFLPIEKCERAVATGQCWTVVWGDHNIVIPMQCSYCKAGLNARKQLGSAMPVKGPTARVQSMGFNGGSEDKQLSGNAASIQSQVGAEHASHVDAAQPETMLNLALDQNALDAPPFELDDVLSTDLGDGFDLPQELWQYE